jgi:hypothetical protein
LTGEIAEQPIVGERFIAPLSPGHLRCKGHALRKGLLRLFHRPLTFSRSSPPVIRNTAAVSDLAGQLLARGHGVRMSAEGASMGKAIPDGSVIVIEPAQAVTIAEGDVLLYRAGMRLLAHRVVRIDREASPQQFVTRGDAPGSPFERVNAWDMLGQVGSVERPNAWKEARPHRRDSANAEREAVRQGGSMQRSVFPSARRWIVAAAIAGLASLSAAGQAWGQTRTATVSGNWSNTATWGGASVPTAANDVTINDGITVTVDVPVAANSITFAGGGTNGGITVSGSNSLTVTNAITFGVMTTNNRTRTLAVGNGTVTADRISLAGSGTTSRVTQVTIGTGTLTLAGTTGVGIIATGTTGNTSTKVVFSGAGTLNVGGTGTLSSFGTLTTVAGSTVNYNGANQNIGAYTTYNVLTLSGTGTKSTIGATTVGGALTVSPGATFAVGAFNLTVTGTTSIASGADLNFTSPTGTKIFVGKVTVDGTWSNDVNNSPVTFRGGITNNGTVTDFKAGTGIQTFATNAQALNGTLSIPNLTVTTITLTNNGTLTVPVALAGTGNLTNAAGATLALNGTSSVTTLANSGTLTKTGAGAITTTTFTNAATTGTVNLNGTGTLAALTNSGTVNLNSSSTITAFTNAATGIFNVNAVTVPTITTLTATAVGNTVNYTAAGQTLKVAAYHHLNLSGGAKTFGAITTVAGNLDLSGAGTTATTGANLAVGGTLSVGTGATLATGANFTLGVAGATTIGGSLVLANTGAKTFTGDVTVSSGGIWNETGVAAIGLGGNFSNSGTFTASTGVHTFSGTAKAIDSGSALAIPSVTVTGTVTNNATLTVASALAGAGTLTQGASATLNVGGTASITTLTASATGNTVNYTGASAQVIPGTPGTTYYNLAFSGAAKSTAGGITIEAGGRFEQGCAVSFTASGALTLNGSYLNCNDANAGGTATLTVGGITVAGGATFDFVGAASGTPTVSLSGTVANSGVLRIWGGGRTGGAPTCSTTLPTLTTVTGSASWTGGGNFHLVHVNMSGQSTTPPITVYASNNGGSNTNFTFDPNCPGGGASATAVKVERFTATPTVAGMQIDLRTGRDVDNLGFNLWREMGGRRVKLNDRLFAGTALTAGQGTVFTAGQVRRWLDPSGDAGAAYWLEEVDLSGLATWHGPATASTEGVRAATATKAARADAPLVEMGTGITIDQVGRIASRAFVDVAGARAGVAASGKASGTGTAAAQDAQRQLALAAGAAVRLEVTEEGWYRLGQPELLAAGLDAGANPSRLQLYRDGVQVPILVQSANNSQVGPQDAVFFYGRGANTPWSGTQAYWLVAGGENGARIGTAKLGRGAAGAGSFDATVTWKPRSLYFAALLNGEGNNFFGPAVTSTPVNQALPVTHLSAGGAASLRVKLQGATAGGHAVVVSLNGTRLGEVLFNDRAGAEATFAVNGLQAGAGTVTLYAPNSGDVSAVDEVALTYPHAYVAEGDALRFTAEAGKSVTVAGFASASVTAIDITDPANPVLQEATMGGSAAGGYTVTLVPAGSGTRTILAVGAGQVRAPARMAANASSSWNAAQAGHDMVVIGHASLLPSAEPLVSLRRSQGLKVAAIDVQDLYDEFSFGAKSPHAIKAFLSAARANWVTKPRFVLLLGNGTFDPRGYLGRPAPDLVPVKLVDTRKLETASDDWFVDFDDDGLPDMAIGRLPAETAAAADQMITRTVDYDRTSNDTWATRVLLVSGRNQEAGDDFASLSNALLPLLPPQVGATTLVHSNESSAAADLVQNLNAGYALVNYAGHGSNEIWSGGLFGSTAASGLANGAATPVVLAMTCLNGSFHDVYTNPLAKALLNAQGGGAVAVWASTGLTESAPQAAMNRAMVGVLYGPSPRTLGEAAAAAKAATGDPDVRRTWVLLGDPSTYLQ